MKVDHNLDVLPDGTTPSQPKHSGLRRAGKITGIFVIVVLVLGVGTGLWVWHYVSGKFNKTHDSRIHVTAPKGGNNLPPSMEIKQPINIIVLGSDARDVIEGSLAKTRAYTGVGTGGQRSDTMMLIHLTDGGRRATVLSFPRDLRVTIPGHGTQKINAAYNWGPNTVIQTINSLTGITINHYVEINFSSFQKIVNAVGGVRLCVTRKYDDPHSGLYVSKPGCYNFDGNKALAYVRMRYQDPEGDFGRVKRQQEFMRVLLDKVKGIGFLADIPRVLKLADAVSVGVKTDNGVSLSLVRTIAEKLAGYGASNVDFRMVPSRSELVGGISYDIPDQVQAQALYDAIRNDTPLPPYGKTSASIPTPADVTLDVENASGISGAGKAWAAKLKALGFHINQVKNAPKVRTQTQIAYGPDNQLKGNLVSEYFSNAQLVSSVNLDPYADVVILIGKDHAAEAMPSPKPSAAPTG